MKEESKDLNYYKDNCKEDLAGTPISVLRYVTELEMFVERYNSPEMFKMLFEVYDAQCDGKGNDPQLRKRVLKTIKESI